MHFHFCLATMPQVFRRSVQDIITFVTAGLEECGCRVTIDEAELIFGGSAINLILEHFEGESANDLVALKRAKGRDFPLGILFTEDLRDANVMAGDFAWRTDSFRRVAEVADFIWYVIPGTELRTDIVDPTRCRQIEFGYCERFANITVQKYRDIDFFLPGLTYPRRKPILEKLHSLGYHVRSSDLVTPAYIYHSLIGRAKAILDIRRFENTRTLSVVRICMAATNGIAVVAEKFDNADFEELYPYTVSAVFDAYVERCISFVEREDPIAVGLATREKFKRERPFKPSIELLLSMPEVEAFRS